MTYAYIKNLPTFELFTRYQHLAKLNREGHGSKVYEQLVEVGNELEDRGYKPKTAPRGKLTVWVRASPRSRGYTRRRRR